jgi:hypothetical protein
MSKKNKRPKMDRYLISVKQPHELDYVVNKMIIKEGIVISPADVILAVKTVGHSRRKVYQYFRDQKHK